MIVDFHNHLIPGVDDGAQTVDESEQALRAFTSEGVQSIVVTPHFDAGLTLNPSLLADRLDEIEAGWEAFTELCAAKFPGLPIHRAVELLLDVPEPDLSDPRLRIDGGSFFLMEFPYMTVPPHSARVIEMLAGSGYIPIIAHPERYHGVGDMEIVNAWKAAGAYLQINGGSLLGRYGSQARKLAFYLLERGYADYVCSDYHGRGSPLVSDYEQLLMAQGGEEQAHTLMRTNPNRLLAGERPIPVQPLQAKRSIWSRVGTLFK